CASIATRATGVTSATATTTRPRSRTSRRTPAASWRVRAEEGGAPAPPRVSVVMPAHNAAAHIGQALDSVAAQTFTDWEVIVCDDASSDDTAELACGRERVTVIVNERNAGPAESRNRALAHARGELVAFLDADD